MGLPLGLFKFWISWNYIESFLSNCHFLLKNLLRKFENKIIWQIIPPKSGKTLKSGILPIKQEIKVFPLYSLFLWYVWSLDFFPRFSWLIFTWETKYSLGILWPNPISSPLFRNPWNLLWPNQGKTLKYTQKDLDRILWNLGFLLKSRPNAMANPNCCFMIKAVKKNFSSQSPRGTVYQTSADQQIQKEL